MTCEQATVLMASALESGPDPLLQKHLSGCLECAREMAAAATVWNRMADIPVPEPSRAMSRRFAAELDAMVAAQSARAGHRAEWTWANWWPRNPAWQLSIAFGCLLLGLAIGATRTGQSGEIARLRDEIAGTREMVALSLLQQQSATGRLQGVEYSSRMKTMDPEVVAALVQAVERDPSINVRLAAVDALGRVTRDEGVRRTLTQSLGRQDSPMVQAALIDYFVDARDRGALGAIRNLEEKPDLNSSVRERSRLALRELSR